ncbi:hypothetical protein CTAYLR_002517 [Chrysophaeum taylorii]|uniref:L-2-hydroxyglutarate dehydrogenase, mitochondrial n=1 Tax=Chrysophaeum taylorii TaxID=2483200 RepID=A0AAD7UGE9_9STRA|nr:hypothetical protein CTAYLR_002517 [Chrysophaeum taylorii]
MDVCVVGAGVVGLAVARAAAKRGLETLVLEGEATIGHGISSRNSGVVHAGLYYAGLPLKQRWCLEGKRLLYEYCEAKKIPHARCGKLVVAQGSQLDCLEALLRSALRAGVEARLLSREETLTLEPLVRCDAALLSPTTGIVDAVALMEALRNDAEAYGATVVTRSRVSRATPRNGRVDLDVDTAGERDTLACRRVVNATGLHAAKLHDDDDGPRHRFAKGSYFACRARPFSRLVYPLPEPGGLGIHATVDLDGAVRFGPDVEWLAETDPEDLDFAVDETRAPRFYDAVRTYYPGLRDGDLRPDYSGIRPKLDGDFRVVRRDGLISLLGIESPGLTAALAIAEAVVSTEL